MPTDSIASWVVASLLLGLRVSPVFALAPPFTLTRVPVPVRVMLGLGLSGCLVAGHPEATAITSFAAGDLAVAALRELLLGSIFVMVFQLTFGAIQLAGRTIDIQAGFGLAALIDPTTRNQMPLVGTLFAYAAGAIFFGMNGHLDLLRILSASLETVPLGAGQMPDSLVRLTSFISVIFVMGLGVGGGVILSLFLADVAIALMSRTVPQMNVLVLGFQIKTMVMLLVLATTFGVSGAVLARMMALTLETLPGLF